MTVKDPIPTVSTVDPPELGPSTSPGNPPDGWGKVAELAGKMGEQDKDDPAREELLDYVKNLEPYQTYFEEGKPAPGDEWEGFLEKMSAGGYWYDKEITDTLAGNMGVEPYELCDIGMPAKVILENEDYYMAAADTTQSDISLNTMGILYEEMSATPEGIEKFRKDFVERDSIEYDMIGWLSRAYQGKEYSEPELKALHAIKDAGISLASAVDWLYIQYEEDGSFDLLDSNKKRQSGAKFGAFLLEHQLFDGEDLKVAYEDVLASPTECATLGLIDVGLSAGIPMPEDSSEDAKYWHQLSEAANANALADFLVYDRSTTGKSDWAERLQDNFDFTKPPVMKVFAKNQAVYSGIFGIADFDSPQFLEALKIPEFQDIIMGTIEEQKEKNWNYITPPTLFLMLAQNREALEDMQARQSFLSYPRSQEIEPIGKLARGEFTEQDRLALFIRPMAGHSMKDFFNENGKPRQLLINEIYKESSRRYSSRMLALELSPEQFLDKETLSRLRDKREIASIAHALRSHDQLPEAWREKYFTIDQLGDDVPRPEFWQKCLEVGEIDTLAFLDKDSLRDVGFDKATLEYLRFYRLNGSSSLDYIEPDEIHQYFDESGPRPKLWQKCLEMGDYRTLANINSETIKNMGFGDTETQFILGISNNDILHGEAISKDNIIAALTRFIKMDAEDWLDASDSDLLIKNAFDDNSVKDLALSSVRALYENYLSSNDEEEIPAGLKMLYEYMTRQDGAGPLTQIEALLNFTGNIDAAGQLGREYTQSIEQKINKAHWDNQHRANFYSISAEVLQASPDLYLEFAKVLANIPSQEDFKTFADDIYPLFRAKLALLRQYEDYSNGIGSGYSSVSYDSTEIDELKNQLHIMLAPFNLQELPEPEYKKGINIVHTKLLGEISELFQAKFGFLPGVAPSDFSKADTKALEDMTLYLGNIVSPTERNKDIIGFFLALQFDKTGAWDKMRSGEDIRPSSYLNVASAFNVSSALLTSQANNPINTENTGITAPERLRSFRAELQKETTTRRLGNVQTIDLRLQNLTGNMAELTDPDLYPEKIDKDRIGLLRDYSVKAIGKAAAITYQRMSGKDVPYGDGEEQIAGRLIQILQSNGIEVAADSIKNYFQSGLSGIKEPFSIMANIEQENTLQKIQELQAMLTPPSQVVQIFDKLGENFKPQSGTMALSSDLDYLENLVVKQEETLSEEELSVVRSYINTIRSKMADLNTIYGKTVQNFSKMNKSLHSNAPVGVRAKMRDIEKIVKGAEDEEVIVTTCTTSMTTIIENMRACLSCKTKGINNDTDLTFGEGYKFYLYSVGSATRADSSTDEIVYFVPVDDGTTQRMSFVMDQMYGNKNEDIMISHLENVVQKASRLKEQFPEVPISVVLPDSSMMSCGTRFTPEELTQKIGSAENLKIVAMQNATATIPESGFGDHYVEFGSGDARTPGDRTVDGIEIIL